MHYLVVMFGKLSSWWSDSPSPAIEKSYDPTNPKQNPLNPQGLKPCCACPQTKSARDDCFLKHGDEATEKCKEVVENHLAYDSPLVPDARINVNNKITTPRRSTIQTPAFRKLCNLLQHTSGMNL
ncbi:hypothetical protein D9756_009025 [Leucocoprinus leucothites]|uniref:Uncharacterized protein n=1 Tax=Leucocoprinus leucothites TaxID=201217 RepID=A0A8H5FUI6_9AGAR|nr:hypothetical protein D9756_009025 [Leucoagaricus leucothites]